MTQVLKKRPAPAILKGAILKYSPPGNVGRSSQSRGSSLPPPHPYNLAPFSRSSSLPRPGPRRRTHVLLTRARIYHPFKDTPSMRMSHLFFFISTNKHYHCHSHYHHLPIFFFPSLPIVILKQKENFIFIREKFKK